MKISWHCKRSMDLFGETGKIYHEWIDSYAVLFNYWHRDIFHHKEGIEIGVQIFGECCRKHLRQHIIDDLNLEGDDTIPTIQELRDEQTELTKRLKERKNGL